MFDWIFRLTMKALFVVVITGIIVFLAWKIATFLAILVILSPFGLMIYLKVVKKIKAVEGV